MASVAYGQALLEMVDQNQANSIDLINETLFKAMLTNSTYTPDKDDTIVDAGGASDPIDAEINATGYSGGYGGEDRLALSSKAFVYDTANNRVEFDAADLTWSALGNGTNDTITHCLLIIEDHLGTTGDDTETRLVFAIDVADTTTNGGDITISWDAEGIVQYA